jgi:hypothetical protein
MQYSTDRISSNTQREQVTLRLAPNSAAIIAILLLCSSGLYGQAHAKGGTVWMNGTLSSLLAKEGGLTKPILVKVDAAWCPGCRNLDREIFGSKLGSKVLEGRHALKVDFDDQRNRPVIERYAILGLPTVLLLSPEGKEIGRVVGYPGSKKWLAKFNEISSVGDGLAGLEDRFQKKSDDPAVVLRLSKTLLNRGLRKRAIALLETVSWLPGATDDQKAESLFVMGRYFHRVRRQPDVARHIWRELATRYPVNAWAGGAWWWYARAQAELGRHQVGQESLKSRYTVTKTPRHAMSWAKYLIKHDLAANAAEAIAILKNVEASPQVTKELRTLLSELTRLTAKGPGNSH